MSTAVILSDVAELVMGQSPPSASYNDVGDGLPFYQGKTDFGATFPTPRIYCREPKKLAEAGDILMSVRAPVGATNLCKSQSCIGRGIAAIRANSINRDFLYFYLKKIEAYIDSLGSGAIFKAINKSQLAELPINDAGIPLPEQKKIAYILSTVQRAIEMQERIIQTTTELKKALMYKLFTKGLRNEPQKKTEIGPVPESWETPHLGEVAEIRYGLGQPPQQAADGVPMIRATNIKRGRISGDGLIRIKRNAIPESRNPYLRAGDVVVVRSGAYTGDVAMITDEWAGSVAGYDLIVSPGSSVNSAFCAYAMLSAPVQQHFKGQSNRAAQAHLNRQQLQTTHIPLPSRNEQDRIAEVLDTAQKKIDYAEKRRAVLQDLFRTLLRELMAAKIRVRDLEFQTSQSAK